MIASCAKDAFDKDADFIAKEYQRKQITNACADLSCQALAPNVVGEPIAR